MSAEMKTATSLWEEACRVVRENNKIAEESYEQWFGNMVPLELRENTLVLGASDSFFGTFFSENMGSILSQALEQIMGAGFGYTFEYGHTVSTDEDRPSSTNESDPDYNDELAGGTLTRDKLHRISEVKPISAPDCRSNYTFTNFVVGEENKYAYFAAQTAASSPGTYNPLYIYGGTGMGKTHLMQAVANEAVARNPNAVVRYVTCEGLLNAYSDSLRNKTHFEFRKHFRDVDLLLVDDVHFLGSKEQLQEEFFNIFNTLHNNGKQIILTSDKTPAEIPGLADRLVSRFESGLITKIEKSSFETRLAILQKKQEKQAPKFTHDVLSFIAQRITSSIRRLEGALMRLVAYSSAMHESNVTPAKVEVWLSDFINQEAESHKVSIESIQRTVAEYYKISKNDLIGPKRPKNISNPRMVAMFLCRKMTNHSLPEIGLSFGGRTHATVIHAVDTVEKEAGSNESFKQEIDAIRRQLQYQPLEK